MKRSFVTFEKLVEAELDPNHEVCPFCGSGYIVEGSKGAQYGVCPKCYGKAKIAGLRAAMDQYAVEREYATARKQKSRGIKSGEISPDIPRSPKPDFEHMDQWDAEGHWR